MGNGTQAATGTLSGAIGALLNVGVLYEQYLRLSDFAGCTRLDAAIAEMADGWPDVPVRDWVDMGRALWRERATA